MMRAVWNGAVIAESPHTVRLEGNHYFPVDSVRHDYLIDSPTRTLCPWKGLASYYTLNVDGDINPDAAWYYRRPSPLAGKIKDHVAFWHGVQVEGQPEGPSDDGLPVWRIGISSGIVGILCCVGPTVLALFGTVSAATAFVWANDLYGNYAWWFRLGGLVTLVGLSTLALKRRNQCSIDGVRRARGKLLAAAGIAVATYAVLYGVTTWMGTLA